MERQWWTLLIINYGGEEGLTPAQLQKALFLTQKAIPDLKTAFYNFVPYNYGPFDVDIYMDADRLAYEKFIEKNPVKDHRWEKYKITNLGSSMVKSFETNLHRELATYLEGLVRWIQSLTFQELIASIYKQYPEYRVNSVFRGEGA